MQIAKYESYPPAISNALQKLEPSQSEIIKAALSTKIQKLDRVEVTSRMVEAFGAAHEISGQDASGVSLAAHAIETYDWLMRLYPEVTLDEISSAIRAGVYDEFGKYYGLNPKTYVFFVREYLQSEKRKLAKQAYESAKEASKTKHTETSCDDFKRFINQDYEVFKKNGPEFILFNVKNYIFLRRQSELRLKSRERWNIWLLEAKNRRMWVETQRAKNKGDKSTLNAFSKLYENFEQNGSLPFSEFRAIVFECRKMRYIRFFEVRHKSGEEKIFYDV